LDERPESEASEELRQILVIEAQYKHCSLPDCRLHYLFNSILNEGDWIMEQKQARCCFAGE
jgi:hypothetical protein